MPGLRHTTARRSLSALRAPSALKSMLAALLVATQLGGCSTPALQSAGALPTQPEGASGLRQLSGWTTRRDAVAAANPIATQAGLDMLRAGGSAIDAAIAVQMVLTLVEPQSSGLGGGAFLLYFDGQNTQAYDGRETAPAGATPELFLKPDGKPMDFADAVLSGRSVGVPGAVRMLEMAHRQHGKLPWAQLFQPAIALARQGFAISPRMATLLASEEDLKADPVARAYFYDANGKPWPAGHLLRNPELAEQLQAIADHGADALMQGALAQAVVNKAQHHAVPGSLSLQDLASYRAIERTPLCFDYRVAAAQRDYRICGMPPPSSGTLAIGQILGLLQHTPAATLPLENQLPGADWLHLYTEASRLAFADRGQFVADPDFVSAPGGQWLSLLAPDYLAQRARLIDSSAQGKSMQMAPPGEPGAQRVSYAPMAEQTEHGTSHISIVDASGQALAMTTTIEDAWGSRQMVNRGLGLSGGFLLNNQLTDFSLQPTGADAKPVANRVEPGKRPRSSMSPVLVFDRAAGQTGQLVLSAGSPGGAMIIHFTAKTLYGILNWGLSPQEAISLPNFGALNGPTVLEQGRFSPATVEALRARDHRVAEIELTSGLQAIMKTPTGYAGGADPRREGLVLGD